VAEYYVYILASQPQGTLYVGVTNDLARRVFEHKGDLIGGFTKRYGVHRLVYYETYADIREAIGREKAIKKWRRAWKVALIERDNAGWSDLYERLNS
jgi:putative endonuclease